MALEREHETYMKELATLLGEGKRGKFALVHGDEIAGTWDTWDEAAQAGYDRFGLETFLVRQVTDEEKILFISRNIKPCPNPK